MLKIIPVDAQSAYLHDIKALFREYEQFLGISLCFQDFEAELASLPGKFSPPLGNLYLATWQQQPAGCTAYYPLEPTVCELKRLFVRPEFQGYGLGKALIVRAMQDAAKTGYHTMVLDSLHRLEGAEKLYQKLGFEYHQPYNQNPHADVYYMKKSLQDVSIVSL